MCDLGAVDRYSVSGAVGHVLAHKLATLSALEATLIAHSRQGRAGITALREAIDDWSIESRPADSVLEPAMRRLVARYHLPPVEFHATIQGREVDFRFIGTPVIVECDGWAYHGLVREQFERDRSRDAELIASGWIVLRFTYRAITDRPGSVARQISAALVRWSRVHPPDAG
jgi:very-short-patch-repair endonuclease